MRGKAGAPPHGTAPPSRGQWKLKYATASLAAGMRRVTFRHVPSQERSVLQLM